MVSRPHSPLPFQRAVRGVSLGSLRAGLGPAPAAAAAAREPAPKIRREVVMQLLSWSEAPCGGAGVEERRQLKTGGPGTYLGFCASPEARRRDDERPQRCRDVVKASAPCLANFEAERETLIRRTRHGALRCAGACTFSRDVWEHVSQQIHELDVAARATRRPEGD